MAFFLPCPNCERSMPRAAKVCPHCSLTLEQAIERKEGPENEKPPLDLYLQKRREILQPEQKLGIGFFFFLFMASASQGRFLSAGLFFTTGIVLTPAAREYLGQKLPFVQKGAFPWALGFLSLLGGALLF